MNQSVMSADPALYAARKFRTNPSTAGGEQAAFASPTDRPGDAAGVVDRGVGGEAPLDEHPAMNRRKPAAAQTPRTLVLLPIESAASSAACDASCKRAAEVGQQQKCRDEAVEILGGLVIPNAPLCSGTAGQPVR